MYVLTSMVSTRTMYIVLGSRECCVGSRKDNLIENSKFVADDAVDSNSAHTGCLYAQQPFL